MAGVSFGGGSVNSTNVEAAGAVMESDLIASSAGAADAGKPVKTNGSGLVDSTFIDTSVIVVEADYNAAQTILARQAGATPTAITFSASRLFGRPASGNVDQLTMQQVKNMLLHNDLRGLGLSNNGSDANNDIDIAAGEVLAASADEYMILAAGITGRKDAAWAVGTNQGKMDSGSNTTASTANAVWLIKRTDGSAVDVLFSASFTSPSMPAGYTFKRRIGAFVTDGSNNIVAFIQSGDYFRLLSPVQDVNDNTITDDTFESAPLRCPPLALAHIYGSVDNVTITQKVLYIRTNGATDAANQGQTAWNIGNMADSPFDMIAREGWVLVNSSSQIQYTGDESGGTSTVDVRLIGWIDFGRRSI